MGHDVIIVGAGSAGCVLAARLSEDAARSVLLLEAGPDYPDVASLPPEIAGSQVPAFSHDWGYDGEPDSLGQTPKLPRARLVGGCSATNAAVAMRGAPAAYDAWAARGNPGWASADVLSYFRRLEHDLDYADAWHGQQGPLPIRRLPPERMGVVQQAFLEACVACGHQRVRDHNAPGPPGAGPAPTNAVGGVRQSAALTYLAQARPRANLTIRAGTHVDRVLFEAGRAVGVHTVEPAEDLAAGAVVLACGAYGSPAVLLRSGLGPATALRDLGVTVRQDLPGVGRHLTDHPLVVLGFPAALAGEAADAPLAQAVLTLRSAPSVPGHDLLVVPCTVLPATPDESPTGAVHEVLVSVAQPQSRGWVRLRSADPSQPPRINPGYFSAAEDMPRMLQAVREALQLAAAAPMAKLLGRELYLRQRAGDEEADLERAVRRCTRTFHHPVGTCPMGPDSDPDAVVNHLGKVRGVEGLFVVDASIMPGIPSVPTNVPTLMVAERCADLLQHAL